MDSHAPGDPVTAAPAKGSPPDFIAESVDELRGFLRTLAGFSRHPAAFTRAWSEGAVRATNPVAFFGLALGLQLGATAVLQHFRPLPESPAATAAPTLYWLGDILSGQLPLLTATVFAAAVHWRMRRKGSTQTFAVSLGTVLFAEGWQSVGLGLISLIQLGTGPAIGESLDGALSLVRLGMLAVALTGVHGRRRWTSAIGPLLLGALSVVLVTAAALTPVWLEIARQRAGARSIQIELGGPRGPRVIRRP